MFQSLLSRNDKLDFDFNIRARRQIEPHQHIDRLRVRIEDIDQTIVSANLIVLVRVFIYECRAPNCKPFELCWQGYWPNYMSAAAFSCLHNTFGRLIQDTMIVGFKPDADLLLRHEFTYSMILVTTPAPTVRPPSRIANLEPCSSATGTINSTVRLTSSPGITISTPSGKVMLPVTSIVRM